MLQWEEWLISASGGRKTAPHHGAGLSDFIFQGTGAGGTFSGPQARRYNGVHKKAGEGGVCPWVEAEQSSHGDNHILHTEGCLGQVGVGGTDLNPSSPSAPCTPHQHLAHWETPRQPNPFCFN